MLTGISSRREKSELSESLESEKGKVCAAVRERSDWAKEK